MFEPLRILVAGTAGLSMLLLFGGLVALSRRRRPPEPSPFDSMAGWGSPARTGTGRGNDVAATVGGVPAWLDRLGRAFTGGRDTRRLQARLEAADLMLRPHEWYSVRLTLPLAAAAGAFLIHRSLLAGVLGGTVAALAPGGVLRLRAARRRARLEEQLPDAVRMMLNAVEAGRDIRGALLLCAGETSPSPLRGEFARIQAELQLAVPLDDAMRHAAARIGVRDFEILVDGLAIHRQVGGQIGTMLRSTIETLRARAAFRGRLKALTAQSRASKWVVSGLVPAVVLALSLLAPTYMTPMFTSVAGWAVMAAAGTMIAVAFHITGRLTDIEV